MIYLILDSMVCGAPSKDIALSVDEDEKGYSFFNYYKGGFP